MDGMWDRIQSMLSERRISHADAAEVMGMNLHTFRGKMYRNAMLSAVELYRLAVSLETTMEYILVGRDPMIDRYVTSIRELESLAVTSLEVIRSVHR